MPNLKVPIYIVDDDLDVRESLQFMLESYDFKVTGYADGNTFIEQAELTQPGCVILDSRMPKLRGQEVQQLLNQQQSPLSIIFLTGHGDVPMAVEVLKLGAVDFFQKPVNGEQLVKAIYKACEKSLDAHKLQESREIFNSITGREMGILQLIVKGKRNQQIAELLCIAVRTVEVHRSSLMKKLNAKTIADLVMIYVKTEIK
jgi:two-component system response regulator TtrR